ncbi:hypothetical protein ACFQRB_05675 [Halobaculum litoreum]|uniref:HEAT repeat-containing protein n=1 Tax=Halobaculum litoreum TaxID=3031998 RepID=A0ABD5XSU1_9EURY
MSDDFGNASARGRAPDVDEAALRDRLRADDVRTRRDAALGVVDRASDDGSGSAADGGGVTEATLSALAERVTSDPDPDVRQFAAEALGVAGAAPDRVAPALADDDPGCGRRRSSRTRGPPAATPPTASVSGWRTTPDRFVATRSSRWRNSTRSPPTACASV